ncbi:MAG: HAMP domain-containing histidine kinase [Oscillospiraceae bacterium]|nr:HAMP domain-containing histidine kinase [Oscillospiraceae bacterium]
MILRNPELRKGLWLFLIGGLLFGALGLLHSTITGLLVLLCWLLSTAVYCLVERKRYNRLQELSRDLDTLLLRGTPLPVTAYEEGELSLLADQIQKLTLRLTEATESLQKDKIFLADSLADISHQLRTPLTAMHLTLSLLQNPETEPGKHRELLRDFRSLLHRTQWLVEALLKFSKLDAGTVPLHPAPVPLRSLVEEALAPFSILIELQQQTLSIDCPNCTLFCDAVWTEEAIGNILKNAIEHNPPGGTIRISGKDSPIFTELSVEDEGGGFLPEELPQIFRRFYRGKTGNPKNYGIGLALSKKILSVQNATIQAENCGRGAKFTLKFYKQVL